MEHELTLPFRFLSDHFDRGITEGYDPTWLKNRVRIKCTSEALSEIESDALYYAEDVDEAPKDIIASAKRTVKAIEKYKAKLDK